MIVNGFFSSLIEKINKLNARTEKVLYSSTATETIPKATSALANQ